MKYVPLEDVIEILNSEVIRDNFSWLDLDKLSVLIKCIKDDVAINIPNCGECKFALKRYDGTVKYCECKARMEFEPNTPVDICQQYVSVVEKEV